MLVVVVERNYLVLNLSRIKFLISPRHTRQKDLTKWFAMMLQCKCRFEQIVHLSVF
jgi:hypothetical protein